MQIQQQVSKEYDQLKSIQNELSELTMGLQNAPIQALRRNLATTETESRDPAAWFRADKDIWSPPPRDPDVFGPPIDRSLQMPGRNQKMPPNKKVDNRRGSSKPSAKDAKGGGPRRIQPNSARGTSKDSARKGTDSAQSKEGKDVKDDDTKEEEPQEEEKRFEAANHIDGDLVDVLGEYFISN